MHQVFEIMSFELRQQLRAPFAWAGMIINFLLHLLATGSVGITLWAHPQAYMNSTYAVAVIQTTLTIFEMFPIIIIVAGAVLRDQENNTADLFYIKPISKYQYWTGRFGGICLLSTGLGLAGLAGTMTGSVMPWVDVTRRGAFSIEPFLFSFSYIVIPNLLILSALFTAASIATRSLAATIGLAALLMTFDFVLAGFRLNSAASSGVVALADHSAMLVVAEASSNLSVAELNALTPARSLAWNRLIWLSLSFGALALTLIRSRLRSDEHGPIFRLQWPGADTYRQLSVPVLREYATPKPGSLKFPNLIALLSQLRRELSALLIDPLFLLILLLVVISAISDYNDHFSPVMKMPLYPLTSVRLSFFRYGLLPLAIIMAIYLPSLLINRERVYGLIELTDASPVAGWVLPLAKIITYLVALMLFLLIAMFTAMIRQLAANPIELETGLYLRAVFLQNGFYYGMIGILAVLVQVVLAGNKWLGMLLALALILVFVNLEAMRLEHILYQFNIPATVYSDMNGYGAAGWQAYSLIAYWSFFCGLLIVLTCLLYPRGTAIELQIRLKAGIQKLRRTEVKATTLTLLTCYLLIGGWIFYNTNLLNRYRSSRDLTQEQADYEKLYGNYEDAPAPSFEDINITVDLFPEERQLRSKGIATLTNHKKVAIKEFVVSIDPRLNVHLLHIASSALITSNKKLGFYLYRPLRSLAPGGSLKMYWQISRQSKGFTSNEQDNELLENGTYITGYAIMPMPGFDDSRKLKDNTTRRKFGLAPAKGLPVLGDKNYLDRLFYGIDARSNFHITISTSSDQLALAPGRLIRNWRQHGRHYSEYRSERPTWPKLHFMSARYQTARQRWSNGRQNVDLEIYHDQKHPYNVKNMLSTARKAMDYLTREFGPYPYEELRIIEYPNYRRSAQALPGGNIAYSEGIGWSADLRNLSGLDYTIIHELSHKWWGEQAYGAKMQGREVLNETLAQYSTLMIYREYDKQHPGAGLANRVIADLQSNYLQARNRDSKPEQPLLYTDEQGYVSYNKGALALYELQESIGVEKVNLALRRYLKKFAFRQSPFPNAADLEREIVAVANSNEQELITRLFRKVVTYDLKLEQAIATRKPDGFHLSVYILARQLENDSAGKEKQTELKTWFELGLFADELNGTDKPEPLYLSKYLLHSGMNVIEISTKHKPAYARIDPFHKMADKNSEDNQSAVTFSK